MIFLVLILLSILTALFTAIQSLYVETMRLRARDLPAVEYFREKVEPRIGLGTEHGALTFSLWKHTCLVAIGALMLRAVAGTAPLNPLDVGEGLGAALLLMAISAYLLPQLLFRRSSGHWVETVLPVFRVAALIARPFVAMLDFFHSLIDIVKETPGGEEASTPAENIDVLITAGTEEGLIEEDDRKLIESVIAFGDKVVREVMTPRPNMVTVKANAALTELHELVVHEQFSRIPVCESTIDEIIGFVHVRDMFEVAESDRARRTFRVLMRPIRLVPESKSVHDLLREMQQAGAHMVIVIDEYGNTAGLATMEDLVEVILGEIRDEHEPDSDVKEESPGVYRVSGNFELGRLAAMLDYHAGEEVSSTTIGGLIMEWLGRVPKAGEVIERDGVRAEVLASDEMRVGQVRLSRVSHPAVEEPAQ